MKLQKQKCEHIIRKLIKKSFHKKVKDLWFTYTRKKGFSANIHPLIFGYAIIGIHEKVLSLPKKPLIGIFAHELCHPEITDKFCTIKNGFLRIFSWKKYLEIEEKNVDLLAIDRGYGKNLLTFRKLREKKKDEVYRRYKNFYLNSQEISDYLKLKKLPHLKFSEGRLNKL